MKIEDIIPAPMDGYPISGGPANCHKYWMGEDSEEQFRKRGHPVYGDQDIVYRFNSRGFRGPEFEQSAQIGMISIGCSWVFGHALRAEDTFHELFAARLRQETRMSVVNWNLGISGSSGDCVARTLHLTVPRLNPDIVLVLFPKLARREYVSAHGVIMNYNPSAIPWNISIKQIFERFAALSSANDDLVNFFRNYKSIEALLADRCWLFTFTELGALGQMKEHLDPERYAGAYRFVDRARDHAHPGPETHRIICDRFWTKFVENGGLSRFVKDPQ
jgi:hypothetical protein